jgi:hypothetical protein
MSRFEPLSATMFISRIHCSSSVSGTVRNYVPQPSYVKGLYRPNKVLKQVRRSFKSRSQFPVAFNEISLSSNFMTSLISMPGYPKNSG